MHKRLPIDYGLTKPLPSDYGLTEEQFENYHYSTNFQNIFIPLFLFVVWLAVLITICILTGWPSEESILNNIGWLLLYAFVSLLPSVFLTLPGIAISQGLYEVFRRYIDKNYRNYKEYKKVWDLYYSLLRKMQINYWKSMDTKTFEREIALLYSRLGYTTKVTSDSIDEGVDIFLNKDNKNIIVKCQRYQEPAVPRILYGKLLVANADMAILATIIGVSPETESFIKDKPIEAISLDDIIGMERIAMERELKNE